MKFKVGDRVAIYDAAERLTGVVNAPPNISFPKLVWVNIDSRNPQKLCAFLPQQLRRLIKRKPAETVSVTRKKLVEAYAAAVGAEVTDIAEWPVLLRLCKALGLKGES